MTTTASLHRYLLAAIICGLAVAPRISAAGLSTDGPAASLAVVAVFPLTDSREGLLLPATLAGSSLPLLLDTGSLVYFLDETLAPKLGPQLSVLQCQTPAGSRMSPVHHLPASTQLGPLVLAGQKTGLFDTTSLPWSGTLGLAALRDYFWDFDFDAGKLTVADAPAPAANDLPVPQDCLIRFPVTLPGGRIVDFLLDTGCTAPGTLEASLFDELTASSEITPLPPAKITTSASRDVAVVQGTLRSLTFQSVAHAGTPVLRSNENRLGWPFFIRYHWQICLGRGLVSVLPRQTALDRPPVMTLSEKPAEPGPPGRTIYQRACMSCHQADGKGQPGLFPPLRDTDWIREPDPARLIRIVLHGMVGPLSVNGVPFRSAAPFMPGHAASLTDQEIATVLTWIRQEMGGKAPSVSAASVTSIRQTEATRSALWTQAQLLALPLNSPPRP